MAKKKKVDDFPKHSVAELLAHQEHLKASRATFIKSLAAVLRQEYAAHKMISRAANGENGPWADLYQASIFLLYEDPERWPDVLNKFLGLEPK